MLRLQDPIERCRARCNKAYSKAVPIAQSLVVARFAGHTHACMPDRMGGFLLIQLSAKK
jgi:hypothetical protein